MASIELVKLVNFTLLVSSFWSWIEDLFSIKDSRTEIHFTSQRIKKMKEIKYCLELLKKN